MAAIDSALGRPARAGAVAIAAGAAAALVVGVRLAGVSDAAAAQTFVLIFTSILVEALPFILLGALVSAAIEVYVPESAFARVARLPLPLQLPGAALGGLAFPVCECGSVPVARRLIGRGLHPAAGITFMLASPILNPIVLTSTYIAYRGRGIGLGMVAGRAGLGLILAVAAGWALGGGGAAQILRASAGTEGSRGAASPADRGFRFVEHLGGDFFFMGRFLVAGAALAAALQTIIPQSIVAGIARTPLIGSLSLMLVAFVLSLCSEADAFVAVSFTPFPLGSQLAFLVFGPVLDIKLAFLYGGTFRGRFVGRLALVAIPVVLAGSLWFEALLT